MTPDLSLCLIVAPTDSEAAYLDSCLKSVKRYVDEICITITGKNEKCEEVCKQYGAKVSHFDWVDDFAAAREFNFSQATGKWILWLDADDVLVGGDKLKQLISEAEANLVSGYALEYQYAFDEGGKCKDVHWKLQLIKNDGWGEWKGALHENYIEKRAVSVVKGRGAFRVHTGSTERHKASNERNMRILEASIEKDPNEPRNYFYLARAYTMAERREEALKLLEKYLDMSGWDMERYEAHLLIAENLKELGQLDDALNVLSLATLEREDYPDAYIHKGMCYMKKNEYSKAIYNFKIALGQDLPDGTVFFNPNLYSRDLYGSLAFCYLQIGKIDEALKFILLARKTDMKDKTMIQLHKTILQLDKVKTLSKSYLEITKYLKDTGREGLVSPLMHSVPIELYDNHVITQIRKDHLKPEKWPTRSIAVFCGTPVEPWDGYSVEKGGIGGSETAVIELSKRLVKLGWKVTVFNNTVLPPEGLIVDGVMYKNYWLFNNADEFDVLWVWRLPEAFDWDLKARLKILDLHDVMNPLDFTEKRLKNIDKIFVKSKYHRGLLPNIPDDKFVVVGNGISLERFEGERVKDPYRCVYSSSPNRGLDILLENIWPKVRAAVPEATLHVYYGWKTFYQFQKDNPERMKWMKKVQQLMLQPGVVDHERVNQKELAQDLLKTSFWLYPTYFPEIHCITACEMQAAGVFPITSGYAALAEVQKAGIALKGDIYDPEWQEKYTERVINALTNKVSETIDVSDMSWDNVVKSWNENLV